MRPGTHELRIDGVGGSDSSAMHVAWYATNIATWTRRRRQLIAIHSGRCRISQRYACSRRACQAARTRDVPRYHDGTTLCTSRYCLIRLVLAACYLNVLYRAFPEAFPLGFSKFERYVPYTAPLRDRAASGMRSLSLENIGFESSFSTAKTGRWILQVLAGFLGNRTRFQGGNRRAVEHWRAALSGRYSV